MGSGAVSLQPCLYPNATGPQANASGPGRDWEEESGLSCQAASVGLSHASGPLLSATLAELSFLRSSDPDESRHSAVGSAGTEEDGGSGSIRAPNGSAAQSSRAPPLTATREVCSEDRHTLASCSGGIVVQLRLCACGGGLRMELPHDQGYEGVEVHAAAGEGGKMEDHESGACHGQGGTNGNPFPSAAPQQRSRSAPHLRRGLVASPLRPAVEGLSPNKRSWSGGGAARWASPRRLPTEVAASLQELRCGIQALQADYFERCHSRRSDLRMLSTGFRPELHYCSKTLKSRRAVR